MPSRIGFPGTILPNDVVGSSNNNTLPGGCLGYASITSTVNNIGTTPVDVVSVTVTVGTARMIKVTAKFTSLAIVSGSPVGLMSLLNGATAIDEQNCPVGPGFQVGDSIVALDIAPSSGATTYKLTGASPSGKFAVEAGAADQRCFIMVEDVGPTF